MTAPPSKVLGDTDDPTELIPGNVGHVRDAVEDLGKRVEKIGDKYDGFKAIRVAGWAGEAADAYGTRIETEGARWRLYLSLLTKAQEALAPYADTLAGAQAKAQTAIDTWRDGKDATDAAVEAHNEAVRARRDDPDLPHPGTFVDPGEALRSEAKELLDEARTELSAAGDRAMVALGLLPGSNTGSDTDTWGVDGEVELEFSWDAWEHAWGTSASESDDDDDDNGFQLTLGRVEGSAFALHGEATYQDVFLGGNATVDASASYTVGGASASGSVAITDDSVTVAVEVAVTVASVEGEVSASLWIVEADASLAASVGASAQGELTVGAEGVHAEGEVFAGAQVDLEGSIEAGGVGAEGNVGVQGGLGAGGELDAGYHDGEFTIGANGTITLGIGVEIGFTITVDPVEVVETLQDAGGGLWDMFNLPGAVNEYFIGMG